MANKRRTDAAMRASLVNPASQSDTVDDRSHKMHDIKQRRDPV